MAALGSPPSGSSRTASSGCPDYRQRTHLSVSGEAMKENTVERTIMWGDLDALGIVFYPRYSEWMDGCGHLFFEAMGLNMQALWDQRGILFGLVETRCRYVKPGRYHDRVRITTGIDELDKKTLVLRHRFRSGADDRLLVEGFEKRICLDVTHPERFRPLDIPGDIRKVFERAR